MQTSITKPLIAGLIFGLFTLTNTTYALNIGNKIKERTGNNTEQSSSARSEKSKLGGTLSSGSRTSRGLSGNIGSALGLPSIGADMAGNTAGILQYCIEHKYIDPLKADNVKDKLLDKAGINKEPKKDKGYEQGLGGILTGTDGSTFNFDNVKENLKDKACDYVLDNAQSLI